RISPARWMKNMADVLAYVTFQSPVVAMSNFGSGNQGITATWRSIPWPVSRTWRYGHHLRSLL
ncbi:L-alanine exporter AlaE, partial [Klebsiella pneumoniae]|uniref:L-alanine exporter AlaE n=1 Tax=Klebsiella pneumoniae TaxID=573 RepID=UPI003F7DA22E